MCNSVFLPSRGAWSASKTEPVANHPAGSDVPDVRPALIMKLLLQTALQGVAPSLAHLLLGYDVEPSMAGLEESILLPRGDYSCLTIIERALLYQGCL